MPNVQSFSTLRARSYVFRLPLFTRCISFLIIVLWMVGVQSAWDLRKWGALIPDEFNFQTGKSLDGTRGSPPLRCVRRRRAEGGSEREGPVRREATLALAGAPASFLPIGETTC